LPRILGIDTGFKNFGIADLQFDAKGRLELLRATVITTEKSAKKAEVLAASDNMRRIVELAAAEWAKQTGG